MIYKYHRVEHTVAAFLVSWFVFRSCGDGAVNLRVSIGGNSTRSSSTCVQKDHCAASCPQHSYQSYRGCEKSWLKKKVTEAVRAWLTVNANTTADPSNLHNLCVSAFTYTTNLCSQGNDSGKLHFLLKLPCVHRLSGPTVLWQR